MKLEIYSEKYNIKSNDVCKDGYIKLSRMFDALHEVLNRKLKAFKNDRESLFDQGLLWVLGEQTAEINQLPKSGDEITIYCWIGKEFMTFFPVFYEIHDAEDNVLVKVSSIWAIIDATDRDRINPIDKGINLPVQETGTEISYLNTPKHLDIIDTFEYEVVESNLDFNNHMNNAQYFDVIDNINPIISKTKMPHQVITRYAHEAFLGDILKISYGSTEKSVYYSIDTNNMNCMKVRIEY